MQKRKNSEQRKTMSTQSNIQDSAKNALQKPKNKQKSNARKRAELIYGLRDFIKTLPYHLLVMGSVFIISAIFNKWIEAVCFLTAFFSLRYKFETTYHCDSILWCMVFTNLTFAISIIICPPVYMYILGSLLFAYIDCLILWFIQDRKEKKFQNEKLANTLREVRAELDKYLEETKLDPKSVLLEKCRLAGLGKRDTELAIRYYYEQHTPKEIWLWLCEHKEYESLEWDSVYVTLNRIGKKIKTIK